MVRSGPQGRVSNHGPRPQAAPHWPPSPFRLRPAGFGGQVETPRCTWPYMIPHGEERPAGPRLEPWATAASGTTLAALALPPSPCGLRRTSRDAALRAAPQGEGGVGGTYSRPYMISHGEERDRLRRPHVAVHDPSWWRAARRA